MTGNNVDTVTGDEVTEIENLLSQLESWASDLLYNDWRDIENSGSISTTYYTREKDEARARSHERFLVIEKLREKLLCRG